MKKRLILLLSSVLLLTALAVQPIGALKLTYSPSKQYKSSVFYERLTSLKLTGDQRRDIVNVALSQLGYHEGNSRADFGGLNYRGTGNYVEYNYANRDTLDGGGAYYWCASFVTFCARQAGIPTSTIINSVSCDNFVVSFKSSSRYKSRSSGYIPKAGDLIFFLSPGSGRTYASHVGIVVGVNGKEVYTVEGNTSRNMVNARSYSISNSSIVGYGVPAYKGTTEDYSDIKLINGYVEPGIYRVSSETLNLRTSPASSSSVVFTVKRSDELYISEADGDWGKTVYRGKTCWVSLKYLLPQDLTDYHFTYIANGEEIMKQRARAGDALIINDIGKTPVGYDFMGWSKDKSSKNAEYLPGDTVNVSSDVKLYAIFRAKPITVRFFDEAGNIISETVYQYGDTVVAPDAPEKPSDCKNDYTFNGWDKTLIKVARADRDYHATYLAIERTEAQTTTEEITEESTVFSDIIESIFDTFSSDPADQTLEPEEGSAATEAPDENSSLISPTRMADAVSLTVLSLVTLLIFIIKRKQ